MPAAARPGPAAPVRKHDTGSPQAWPGHDCALRNVGNCHRGCDNPECLRQGHSPRGEQKWQRKPKLAHQWSQY